MKKLIILTELFFWTTPVYAFNIGTNYGFGWIDSLSKGLTLLINPAFTIAGIAVLFYLIIGAFRYLTSGGDKNAVSGAQNMITHAIVGFILLIFIFILIPFIFEVFGINIKLF
jgi:hypothetical protein